MKQGVQPGTRFTKAHRRNMSLARLGKKHSQETKDKIAAKMTVIMTRIWAERRGEL